MCYGREAFSPTLNEEHIFKIFEIRLLRGTFGYKREQVTGYEENYIMRRVVILI
jgi:hypothetical protein